MSGTGAGRGPRRATPVRSAARGAALAALLAGGLLPAGAGAHELYLVPGTFAPAPAEVVPVHVRVGPPGEAEPVRRDDSRIVRFVARGPRGDLAVPGKAGGDPAGAVHLTDPGLWAVGYVTRPTPSLLAGPEFERYLAEEGLEHVARERRRAGQSAAPGRELYFRSVKTLVAVGASDGGAADRPLGLPLELLREAAGDGRVQLRLLHHGEPVPGARVSLRALAGGPAREARTGSDGRVAFAAPAGEWLAHTVVMTPAGEPGADWLSAWATLTFAVPAGPAAEAAAAPSR